MSRYGILIVGTALLAVAACGDSKREAEVELPPDPTPAFPTNVDWEPLWDGRSLQGWHVTGSGDWAIVDTVLIGTHEASNKEFGHLVSDSVYDDFLARVRFKAVSGNSGLYFRSVNDPEKGLSGLQVEINPAFGTGGLWETNGRGWIVMPSQEDVATWYKPDAWNDAVIRAKGNDVAVWMNGVLSATFRDDDPRFAGWHKGHFAIQLHANEDVDVRFALIEIRPI